MTLDRLILILLGVWALVSGLIAVSNIEIVWMRQIAGLCALALGAVCIFRAARN